VAQTEARNEGARRKPVLAARADGIVVRGAT